MKINESDIAILIPTYNSGHFICRCLTSAIYSKAGEIIISDDNSTDNTEILVKQYSDNRIKYFKNPERLGLWENHLQLIKLSSKPWIKFIQADDYLSENGLTFFCDNDEDNLSVVSALSINEDLINKNRKSIFNLSSKKRFSSGDYLKRLKIVGNELSTPSNTLIRKENITLDAKYWKSDTSADLVMNIIAASKGDVVLLPPGPIIRGIHKEQDTNKQSLILFIDRLHNSIKNLREIQDNKIIEFANVFLVVESLGIIRIIIGQILRGRFSNVVYFLNVIKGFKMLSLLILIRNIRYIIKMYKWKFGKREEFNLDF